MQWKAPKESLVNLTEKQKQSVQYTSAVDILAKVYRQEGLRGWYNGMSAQIMKAVLSQAIVFTIKEKLTFYTTLMFIVLESKLK
jgi:solute carrier family 25 (peroxisomal adenine nucleotide transporter), member 17